jgi:hypothetical protein
MTTEPVSRPAASRWRCCVSEAAVAAAGDAVLDAVESNTPAATQSPRQVASSGSDSEAEFFSRTKDPFTPDSLSEAQPEPEPEPSKPTKDPATPGSCRRPRRRKRQPGSKAPGKRRGPGHESGNVVKPGLSAAENQSLARSRAEYEAWPVLQQQANRRDGRYTMDLSDVLVQTNTRGQAHEETIGLPEGLPPLSPKKHYRGLLSQQDQIAHERYMASRPPRKFHLHIFTAAGTTQTGTVAARALPELLHAVRQRVKKPTAPVVIIAPSAHSLQGAQERGGNDKCWFLLRIGDSITTALWPLSMRFDLHWSSDPMKIECSLVPEPTEPEHSDSSSSSSSVQHEWSVPSKFQPQVTDMHRWLNQLIKEYSRQLESPDPAACCFLQWATNSSHAKRSVTSRFLDQCRADCRRPDPDIVPSAWSCTTTAADDATVLQEFWKAAIADVFAPREAPAVFKHSELADVLLTIESSDAANDEVAYQVAQQRADWLLEVFGSSGADGVYQLGRECAVKSKPEITSAKDDRATTVGHFAEGTYVVLMDTTNDRRGRRWAHLVELFVDGDSQLDAMQNKLRGWVQLPEHNPVPPHKALLHAAALPDGVSAPHISSDQVSSLLGAELQLATLMAWARQANRRVLVE